MWDRRLCFASLRSASQSRPRLSANRPVIKRPTAADARITDAPG